jgi:hypothetical protein
MANHSIYKYSSIARPLHWNFPTNRAVLLLLPVAFVLGLVKAWDTGMNAAAGIMEGGRFMAAAFGCWALGRELNPDDHAAPFLSMLLGVLVCWVMGAPGLLLLFTTLVLVRLVNRSTGLPVRLADSILICLLVFWVMYDQASPQFALVSALAFAMDGWLREPLRRQWIFALLCLAGSLVYMIDHDRWLVTPGAPTNLVQWLSLLFLVLFALNVLLLRQVQSVGDVAGQPLDLTRVRVGMTVGLFAALQALGHPQAVSLLVATIAGISLGLAFRKGFNAPPGV